MEAKIRQIEILDNGELRFIGTFSKGKKIKCIKPLYKKAGPFSWSSVGLEYCGGSQWKR